MCEEGESWQTFAGANHHRVRVIHMGVALYPPYTEMEGRLRGPMRVLLAARFDEFKGHRYAVEAVALLKAVGVDVSLQCAGDGPLKATIEKYASALDLLDRVQFPGRIDHKELLIQLRNHQWDVALLPSIETIESREGNSGVPDRGDGSGGSGGCHHDWWDSRAP